MNQSEAQDKYKEFRDKIKAIKKPGLIGSLERLQLRNDLNHFRSQCQAWGINLLEECPFCGSYKVDVMNGGFSDEWYWIECDDCESEGPPAEDRESAIAAWNKRVS